MTMREVEPRRWVFWRWRGELLGKVEAGEG
jgi:hypothetical protein